MNPMAKILGLVIILGSFQGITRSQEWDQHLKLLLLDEQFDSVLQITDTLIVADSLRDRLFYYRGKAFQSTFKFDSAYTNYLKASQADTRSMAYLVAAGQMLARLGRTREAIEVYEDLRMRFQAGDQHLAELANLYTLRSKHSESLKIYLELLEKEPLNYYYLKQAGKCYQQINRTDSTLACFKTASELNPADAYLTYQIANIYLKRKDMENAIWHIQTGIVYDTNNLDLLKLRGYIWLLSGKYQMAIWDLENARKQDSSSVFIQKYLGLSYHEENMLDKAREALLIAYQLDSMDSETAYFLGSSCRWSSFEEEGVYYFNKAIELQLPDPANIKKVYLQLAELYKVLHRFDEALAGYFNAMDYDPSDNVICYKIGQMYDRNLNQKKNAIRYYEKYLAGEVTDHQLFDAEEGKSQTLRPYVEHRINELKEDLFFENQLP